MASWTAAAIISLNLCAQAQIVSPPVAIGIPDQVWGFGFQPRIVRADSRLVATWSNREFGSVLPWATSVDHGSSWILGGDLTPHPLIDPMVQSYGGGAATLVRDGSGRAYLAYRIIGRFDLVHRLVVHRGTGAGGGWNWEPPVVAAVVGTWDGTSADSPWLACDPERGHVYLSYVAYTVPSTLLINGPANQPLYFLRSLDGGQTWSVPSLIGGPAALGSRVEVGAQGEVYVFWQDHLTKQMMLRRSEDFGSTLSEAQPVAGFVDNSRTLMRGLGTSAAFEGRGHPLNYYEEGNVFDFPQLAVDRSSGPHRGTLYMVWAEGAEGTMGPYSGRLVSESEPNDTPATADSIEIGDSFVSYGESESQFPTTFTDYFAFTGTQGRMVALAEGMDEFPANPDPFRAFNNWLLILDPSSGLAPTLYSGIALEDATAPPLLMSLPMTARYVIPGAGYGGPRSLTVYGSIREFLPSPGSVARDHRDIVLTWSRDGGRTWSPKVRVNDDPPGSDQSLPAVAVDELGRVHVAWMDRRDGPQPGLTASPYWAVSLDGGLTFRPSLRVGPASDYDGLEVYGGVGDFIALLPDAGGALIAWPNMDQGWPVATVVRVSDLPTSIAVPRFTAEPDGEAVRVSWTVQDATGITGFALHRAPQGSEDYELVATVASRGTGEHSYTDRAVRPGEGYRYRLQVQRGASSSWEGPAEVALPVGIASLAFERVGPNPFERETRMVLAMPRRDQVDVRVYDVQGHEVRRLYTGEAPAGRHVLAWDGRDSGGREAAPGVYHLRATGAGQRTSRSIVRIR